MVKKILDPVIIGQKTYQRLLVGFLLVIIIFLFVVVFILIKSFPSDLYKNQVIVEEVDVETVKQDDVGVFDVLPVENPSYPVAVMIDNHFEAWDQQFGLSQASIVYSTFVEGGATRFMAIFDVNNTNTRIGPVRSVRPYFIPWALEYDALLVHVGGSPEALGNIAELDVNDLNEMTSYGPLYFERDNDYDAPHNTFTNSNNLQEALLERSLNNDNHLSISHFRVSYDNVEVSNNNQRVFIDYAAKKTYDVEYVWSSEFGGYIRYRFGEPQRDAETGDIILIKNVIIQRVPEEVVLDDKLRIAMDVEGFGEAYVLMNGNLIPGTWKKEDKNLPTRFFDLDGNEIALGQGNVWIEIVPEGHEVEF